MREVDNRQRERRVKLTILRHPERRTGFDRRRASPVIEFLRDSRVVLLTVLVALNLLSLADWVFTMAALRSGATEGNPVMAGLMGNSMVLAGAFKFAVMLGVTLMVWRGRAFRPVLITLLAGVGLYLAVILYHIAGLSMAGVI
jgi:hypothetical protein